MFRDELIGDLLQALPHPSLTMTGGCWSWIRKSGTVVTILVSRNRWWVPPSVRDSGTVLSGALVSRTRSEAPGVCRIRTQSRYRKSLPLILSPDSRVLPDRRTLFLTQTTLRKCGFPSPEETADRAPSSAGKVRRSEMQPDMYGGEPVFSGDAVEAGIAGAAVPSVMTGDTAPSGTPDALPASVTHFAEGRDDIEHLQNEAFPAGMGTG